jgi:hypothetical protein
MAACGAEPQDIAGTAFFMAILHPDFIHKSFSARLPSTCFAALQSGNG